ncbi:MAG: aminopeptidase P family protein, partial [Myxococcaceae bacterium]
ALEPGVVTSNEPGLYRPGRWGIRIENLIATVPAETTAFGEFLRFETLTLCPIDTRLVDPGLLSRAEADWLNAYHATVRERLLPLVEGAARDWLLKRTEAL